MAEYEVMSPDGTALRAWRTRAAGPDVLVCGGLGMTAELLPALGLSSSALTLHGWHHRGALGSARPAAPDRIGLADHVSDAIAVLDAARIERCVVFGWSFGSAIAAELAARLPRRVSALLIATGVPGDPFEPGFGLLGRSGFGRTALGQSCASPTGASPAGVSAAVRSLARFSPARLGRAALPPVLRQVMEAGATQLLKTGGSLLDAVLDQAAVAELAALLNRAGGAHPRSAGTAAISHARHHDWHWYLTLARALNRSPRRDLTGVSCPVTLLAGRRHLLSDPASVAAAIAPLPQARVRVLRTTCVPSLEFPAVVTEELHRLIGRAEAVRRALTDAEPA